jgi:hypothetical protein
LDSKVADIAVSVGEYQFQQLVRFIVSPSTAAGMDVLLHRKPASAGNLESNFPQQFSLTYFIEET